MISELEALAIRFDCSTSKDCIETSIKSELGGITGIELVKLSLRRGDFFSVAESARCPDQTDEVITQKLPIRWMPWVDRDRPLLPDDGLTQPVAGLGKPPGIKVNHRQIVKASAHVARVIWRFRMLPRQPHSDRPRLLDRRQCLGRLAGFAEQIADVVVASGQVALELGDGGVPPCQPLLDRPRLLIRRQCLGRLAGVAEQNADVVVAAGQVALELGDGGVLRASRSRIARACSIRRQRLGRLAGFA